MTDKKLEEAAEKHIIEELDKTEGYQHGQKMIIRLWMLDAIKFGAKWRDENLDYLKIMIDRRDMCRDKMLDTNGLKFWRWASLHQCYSKIVKDMEEERDGKVG